jgi:hypothetical protein
MTKSNKNNIISASRGPNPHRIEKIIEDDGVRHSIEAAEISSL